MKLGFWINKRSNAFNYSEIKPLILNNPDYKQFVLEIYGRKTLRGLHNCRIALETIINDPFTKTLLIMKPTESNIFSEQSESVIHRYAGADQALDIYLIRKDLDDIYEKGNLEILQKFEMLCRFFDDNITGQHMTPKERAGLDLYLAWKDFHLNARRQRWREIAGSEPNF